MKKKILSMLLIFSLIFVLGACSSDDSGYEPDNVDETESAEYEESENYGNAKDLISRGTWLSLDPNGYKVEGEVLTSDLIRASDWDTVQSTYASMNFEDPLPSFDTVSPDGANQDTSAALVGVINLRNVTDGWDFSESSPYDCKLIIKAPDLYGYNASSIYIFSHSSLLGGNTGYIDTNAVMTSNEGKIPFAIVIPEVFTPNEPEGKESVFNATLQFWGNGGTSEGATSCEFTVPRLSE